METVPMGSRLIQRCDLSKVEDGIKLTYQYMGMSEFEFGDQAKSLKRIFIRGLAIHETEIFFAKADKKVNIFVVVGKHFPIVKFKPFLESLANNQYVTAEPTYFDDMLLRSCGLDKKRFSDDTVDAWFDFHNDALFTISTETADLLISALKRIETIWNTPDPPELTAFKEKLEKVKERLKETGKKWFALGSVKLIDGKYHALLNPYDQHIHNFGWYEIEDLEQWVENKGPIMQKIIA